MDASILLLGVALHWKNPEPADGVDQYNAINPGLGLMLEEKALLSAGVYKNSIEETSTFVGLGYRHKIWHGGLTLSLAHFTGYVDMRSPVYPLITAYYEPQHGIRLHAVYLLQGIGFLVEVPLGN